MSVTFRSIAARVVCLALVAGAGTAQEAPPNPFVSDALSALRYGIYCAQEPSEVRAAPDTAAGVVNLVTELPRIRFEQLVVPAAIGIGFGVIAQVPPGRSYDPVTVTVTHPPFPDSGVAVERWQTDLTDLGPGLMGFSFEYDTELVTGEWTFSAEAEGERLFHIAFQVVPQAAAPQIPIACMGGAIS